MSTKTELGVWGPEHYVLYLCAIVEHLHPNKVADPVRAVIDAARRAVREAGPTDLKHLHIHAPPSDQKRNTSKPIAGKQNTSKHIADKIIDIVRLSQGDPEADEKERRSKYVIAQSIARNAEDLALKHLDMDDLAECALAAFENRDADHRDAAVAAMRVGHYDVALDILTREE